MRKIKKVGIFGGTFNPIHKGHLEIAEEIRDFFSLDYVIFIPAGIPPHKENKDIVESHHRLRMTELAVEGHKYFKVSPVEVESPDISYSVNTLKMLKKELGDDTELYFIVGLDAFLEIHTWKNVDELLTLCNFIVMERPGYRFIDIINVPVNILKKIDEDKLVQLDRGVIKCIAFPLNDRYRLYLLRIRPCDISSTTIRKLLRRGEDVKNLLPEPVRLYIMKNNLYRQ